jgi:O-antigen ligase
MLTAFFTLSRAGIAAVAIALAVYLAFSSDRLPKLLILLIAGGGGGALVLAALQRDDLRHGLLNETARHQGDQMLAIAIVVCVLVALLVAAVSAALERGMRPGWTQISRPKARGLAAAAALTVLLAAIAIGAPSRVSNAWDDFKQPTGGPGIGTERLSSASGESRYQFWSAAVKEAGSAPLTGTGAGTFEFWWTRHADVEGTIRDTHSLYLQTLGELGILGIAALAGFFLAVLIGGGRTILRVGEECRAPLAAALAGCVAFCLTATVDWMWQVPAVPVAMLLLASVLVTARRSAPSQADSPGFPWAARAATSVVALALIVATAVPLASSALVRQSQSEAKEGDLGSALDAAMTAEGVEPSAATPRLQLALLYEQAGDLRKAAATALGAAEREETNWRNWLVLSRIEAERGRADAAIAYFRKAKRLNPRSPVFEVD